MCMDLIYFLHCLTYIIWVESNQTNWAVAFILSHFADEMVQGNFIKPLIDNPII